MGKLVTTFAFYLTLILFVLAGIAARRHLHYHATDLVSNGVSDHGDGEESSLHLKGIDSSRLQDSEGYELKCEQMYGFLPCSSNLPGHLFLIVLYEYLLYHGESYAGGDGRIFGVVGNNFFVASAFQLLDSLPESLIFLASGLSSSKEKAQEYVVTGVGLLAGSSILLLTILWGVCFICGRRKFNPGSKSENTGIQILTGSGVVTDQETKDHAKVMLFSLIPLVVILLPSVFGLSYSSEAYNNFVLASLCVSVICLLAYFYYQHLDPRIQKRRLDYAEVERKVEMKVPFYQVQSLMLDREKHLMQRKKEMKKKMKNPEENDEKTMTGREFYDIFQEWYDGTRRFMDDPYSFDKSRTEYSEVAELLLDDKNKLLEYLSKLLQRASKQKLRKEDGKPDKTAIYSFFDEIDSDEDGSINRTELIDFIMKDNNVNDEILMDDEVADIIMRHLDTDENGGIERKEFKSGVNKCLKEMDRIDQQKQSRNNNQKTDGYQQAEAKAKAKAEEKYKAIALLIIGICMLAFLAEPLEISVQKFSESIRIDIFYVSFILVPLATNARTAIAAIRAASQRRPQTTSLTFSEIYHKVFMNNIQGFSVLVSVIYFRGLTWHFSAEVLVVVIVCIIMGLLASFRSKFPDWTLLVAFPLYPLSLVFVYFVNDTFRSP